MQYRGDLEPIELPWIQETCNMGKFTDSENQKNEKLRLSCTEILNMRVTGCINGCHWLSIIYILSVAKDFDSHAVLLFI